MSLQRTISPIDGRVLVERPQAGEGEIAAALERAGAAAAGWRATPVEARAALLGRAIDHLVARATHLASRDHLADGPSDRPEPGRGPGPGGARPLHARCGTGALADRWPEAKPGFTRFVRREPLGLVLVIAPWNYPYLTAVNSIVPALAAGNVVLLKHSAQTPLCAERFQEAFDAAGLPKGVFQHLHMGHDAALRIVASGAAKLVAFTGSVPAGHAVQAAAGQALIATNLELGGKDPAYVREDADLAHAIENLVDGACFNSGQSCCGIERIYVHARPLRRLRRGLRGARGQYVLGDPTEPATNSRTHGPRRRQPISPAAKSPRPWHRAPAP